MDLMGSSLIRVLIASEAFKLFDIGLVPSVIVLCFSPSPDFIA
jgi:hypothetical protein